MKDDESFRQRSLLSDSDGLHHRHLTIVDQVEIGTEQQRSLGPRDPDNLDAVILPAGPDVGDPEDPVVSVNLDMVTALQGHRIDFLFSGLGIGFRRRLHKPLAFASQGQTLPAFLVK